MRGLVFRGVGSGCEGDIEEAAEEGFEDVVDEEESEFGLEDVLV